jgi:hypothetical protein
MKFKYNSQIVINLSDNSYPISCFKFSFDLTVFVVGYTNGKVILIRGDILRDRGSKQRIVYESNDPVTGVEIDSNQSLYITTTSKIVNVSILNRSKPRILSKSGIDLHCETIDQDEKLIVATQSAIKFYNNYQKIKSINFQLNKSRIEKLSDNYLLIISTEDQNNKLTSRVIIFDLFNSHISFNLLIPNAIITHMFVQKKNIYLLSNDGVLFRVHEKPINQQIESIVQRELFPIAYDLAKQANLPNNLLLRIQKLYADHLYKNTKFDESADIYIKCLDLLDQKKAKDTTEESLENEIDDEEFIMNVITKFKDVQNITNLTKFLKVLNDKKLANNDHITLLLCCYCKLKLTDELDNFIEDFDEKLDFNFQLVINLLKECRYFEQVIKLLHKLNQPGSIVDIYLNDLVNPKQALTYCKTLPIDELLLILIDHSKTLLDFFPIETTELLINVFTGKYLPKDTQELDKETHEYKSSNPLTSYQAFLNYLSGSADNDEPKTPPEPTYLPPKPSLIFSSFINHKNEYVIFLEACIETFDKYQGNINDKKNLIMTLLEMYLQLSKTVSDPQHWIDNAEGLIKKHSTFIEDSDLLLLSHIYNFRQGEVFAKQKAGFEESLFTSYQVGGDVQGCFEIVKEFGDSKPELFKLMFKFAVSSEQVFDQMENPGDFSYLLKKIKQYKLIDPLEILQILTSKGEKQKFLKLGLIKDYLIEIIDQQNREISNNTKLMEYYESESTKNALKLTELSQKPFVIQNNKCDECSLRLDFPMIHFKCKHSFHQKCLNNNLIASTVTKAEEKQCPKCFSEIEDMRTIRYEQFKSKEDIEVFETGLNDASDKFRYITDYIGKGVMENDSVTLLGDT